jgi:PAS domain S-box-containing protein
LSQPIATIYLARVVILASLYILTGKLGLLLAVPPGYATLIWPASGIAVGMLVAHGARLWPGVLVGSFVLNAYNSGVFAAPDWWTVKTFAAFCIAVGSTLQALLGRALIARFVGLPLQLTRVSQIVLVFALAGPFVCVVAASVGTATLHGLGIVARDELLSNWLAWWSGDLLGVLVFMPLVLLAPGSQDALRWRGQPLGRLPLGALLLLLLPLALTFYAWKATTENDYQRGEAKFRTLTIESEKALQNRIDSYGNALLGAAGFMQGSTAVSRDEWRTYVETVKVRQNFPGINGLGWIQAVPAADLEGFVRDNRADGAPEFTIHPASGSAPNYIIALIEPKAGNEGALGLNIAFESKRFAAADQARDSGSTAITGRIVLVQDQQRSPGFLLLYPIYHRDLPVSTVEQRRAALRGWTYAPFIASHFLDGLTHSQSSDFRLSIYDGTKETEESLFYAGRTTLGRQPEFTVRTTLDVMQRQWLLVWQSTLEFERAERSTNPLYILIGGLLFTALLALLLVVLTVRRVEHIEQMVGARRFALPMLVFLVLGAGAFTLHSRLRAQEAAFVQEQVRGEAARIEGVLRNQAHERVASLARMADRWSHAGGIPYELWRSDAANHVAQLPGLRALEWIDAGHRVRWVEPLAGNEMVLGLDVRYDAARAAAVEDAAGRQQAALTPPLDLRQGYAAFLAYLPVNRDGAFDGFLAGVFDIDDFFASALHSEASRDFTTAVLHQGREYFSNAAEGSAAAAAAVIELALRIEDQEWTLRVSPTRAFVAAQESSLPSLVLAAGLLVAALAALSARYILISRLKSAHLAESLALNAGIISSSAHLVIAIDPEYRIVTFNRAAEAALGYSAAEVVGHRAIPIFLDQTELEERARTISAEVGESIPVGPRIFTEIPLRKGLETREWTFVRKDGGRFPANVVITPLRDDQGKLTGYLGVIEDIRVRKEVERLKSEFTAVVSHELRTPLTSIRGSLGLILGALSASLPQKVRDLLEIAQSNCERLVLLINDILDIEKFSAGQMRFEIATVRVAEITLQAVEANEGYARKFNVRIELEPVETHCRISVDPHRFVQVMSNLLSNAIKYSPQGGQVRVQVERRGDCVRISVHDQGPGIPEDFRERIFEKFSQADASTTREKGGTGLGLHIARRFVEHMQGRIGYESETGRGSTFWVEFPMVTGRQTTDSALPRTTAGV